MRVPESFLANFWFDGRFQPVIEEFVYGGLKPFDATGQVAFMQLFVRYAWAYRSEP